MPRSRPAIVAAAVGVALLALLVVLPRALAGPIAGKAKAAANASVDARIDWTDAGLSLFGDFPNLTLRLEGVTVVGNGAFASDTLAAIVDLRVVLDLMSGVRSALGSADPIVVRALTLREPRLRLIRLVDGRANWAIGRDTSTADAASRSLGLSLKQLTITRGHLTYDDRSATLSATLAGVNQTLSGDFAASLVDVTTRAEVDSATIAMAGITYLNAAHLVLTADAAADMTAERYTFAKGTGVRINELQIDAAGSAVKQNENLQLDLAFAAPTADVKRILSLVPALYTRDFAAMQATGTLALRGAVKGTYGPKHFPAFTLDARVANGTFRYPDLPLPASDIALDLAVSNPGGSADLTLVNLRRLHLRLGANPIDASLTLRTPISDPDIDARLRGTVDLADLRRTVKLPEVQELVGSITADAALRTRMSWVDQQQYDKVSASGTIDLRNFAVQSAAIPKAVKISEASLRLAPQRAELRSFTGTIGGSDLRASGQLDNLVGYLFRDDDLKGSASVSSNRFLVDEWRSESTSGVIPVPPKVDLTLQAAIGELVYDKIRMTNARGTVRVKDQRVTLDGFTLNTLGGAVAMNGFYETTTPAKPTFDFGMQVTTLDIPEAFKALTTVQQLAPMAKYMQGNFSADFRLNGPLGENLVPIFQQLTGQGTINTTQVAITNFPPFAKAAAATKLALLDNPTLRAINSAFEVKDGRFRLKPFTVGIGTTSMTVSGSNGFDQSLDYNLQLKLPRALMGGANDALQGLVTKASARGIDLSAAPEIGLGITMRGSITAPQIGTDVGASAGGAVQAVGSAVQGAVETRATAVVDSARIRAAAAGAQAVREAETKAEQIRAEARTLAEKVRLETNTRADSLVARAGDNPLRKLAADAAAKKLRKEGEDRAAQIVREGDAKADALVTAARGAPSAQ